MGICSMERFWITCDGGCGETIDTDDAAEYKEKIKACLHMIRRLPGYRRRIDRGSFGRADEDAGGEPGHAAAW
jgi:hypothetical protein